MSNEERQQRDLEVTTEAPAPDRIRVCAFIDGFNLYHALQDFRPAVPVPDSDRYRKYKWLCLTTLVQTYLKTKSEVLTGVKYFTALPNWHGADAKRKRHETYISAQKLRGVEVVLGEFKPKEVTCLASCGRIFATYVEKQTDINIATSMIDYAQIYDKAILLTADSDQLPTIRLLKAKYPEKRFAVLPPIGRGAKDLARECHEKFQMTEDHLVRAQLPNPIMIPRRGLSDVILSKPTTWT
jgi:uncharacterized LabA/DUF88 family protein